MSWKPCRSSGIMFDKFDRASNKNLGLISDLIPYCNPPKFSDINKLSKYYYLYWLNDVKKAIY